MPRQDGDQHRYRGDIRDRPHGVAPGIPEDHAPGQHDARGPASSAPDTGRGRRVAHCTAAATAGTAVTDRSSQATSSRFQPNPRTSAAHAYYATLIAAKNTADRAAAAGTLHAARPSSATASTHAAG